MKKLVFFLFVVLALGSCNNELVDSPLTDEPNRRVEFEPNFELKKQFALSLAKAMNNDRSVREFIKKEALKKVDYDYDVLYNLLKDQPTGNGLTLRENLLKYISEDELVKIENGIKALTIFVPELPEKTFSAELWNVDTEIPCVAIRSTATNDVPLVYADGREDIIESQYIPNFPVVVVKECERMVEKTSLTSQKSLRSASGDVELAFLDDCFDNSIANNIKLKSSSDLNQLGCEALYTAYSIYKNKDGWQRDYIYYGIEPTKKDGPFIPKYQEYISTFSLKGDPRGAYSKISDQTDPSLRPIFGAIQVAQGLTAWTDGEFEFLVRVNIGTKSPIGTELKTFFRAKPEQLFDIGYEGKLLKRKQYIKGVKQINIELPLFSWNLEYYSPIVKIGIEEVDPSESIKKTDTKTVEFAGNFEFDLGFGATVKKGMKFGASAKQTTTNTTETTVQLGNDNLGEVIIDFGDNVVLNATSISDMTYRKYSTGWYEISVTPKRVQY